MPDQLMKVEIAIQGAVQGVGFRPFVFRTAQTLGIRGFVRNDGRGVFISAVAGRENLDAFVHTLRIANPPLATVRAFSASLMTPVTEAEQGGVPVDFSIKQSDHGECVDVDVTRDTAVCENCLREMRDPHNRRYRHPFINCTDCGPRYTIIRDLPYDRPSTTMAGFPMCDECRKEYESPGDRRFHAQPICCPSCGPTLKLLSSEGEGNRGGTSGSPSDPLAHCIALLASGMIVAIKGIGGFHCACRADDESAVKRLRQKKMREEKPLAIMVRDIDTARRYALIDRDEQSLLESVERPIVLCAKKNNATGLAPSIAPGVPTLGIMLPYTPIHHLLFSDGNLNALVMTSGNTTDEPIAFDDDDALKRLGNIADAFLTHNRNIYVRNDDSIVRIVAGGPVMQRRSRGFVPDPLDALHDVHGIVALGGVLKSTVAIGRKRMCYLSQYVGEVSSLEALEGLQRIMKHLLHILDVAPRLFIGDLHPESMTRHLADETGMPLETAQHHHAHGVACMAENELHEESLCIVYDGTGYGLDGCIWGGEILLAGHDHFTRVGHVGYMPLPGADAAIRHPGRMAVATLWGLMGDRVMETCPWMPEEEKKAVIDMVRAGVNCPKTSSMGRLFDAASALLGICTRRTYEGQPAIELEGVANRNETASYEPVIIDSGDELLIDGAGLLFRVYEDITHGTARDNVAARFHNTVARATALVAQKAAQRTGCARICLSGGCFQNRLLLERTLRLLSDAGLQPFTHRLIPPNDECVSFGQLVIAGARREKES
jgi:hydrogenase maturation protein HypF